MAAYNASISNYFEKQSESGRAVSHLQQRLYRKEIANNTEQKSLFLLGYLNSPFQIIQGKLTYFTLLDAITSWKLTVDITRLIKQNCVACVTCRNCCPINVSLSRQISREESIAFGIGMNKTVKQ